MCTKCNSEDAVDAEISRLRRSHDAQVERVSRLRAALQQISDYYPWKADGDDFHIIQRIAEEALKADSATPLGAMAE